MSVDGCDSARVAIDTIDVLLRSLPTAAMFVHLGELGAYRLSFALHLFASFAPHTCCLVSCFLVFYCTVIVFTVLYVLPMTCWSFDISLQINEGASVLPCRCLLLCTPAPSRACSTEGAHHMLNAPSPHFLSPQVPSWVRSSPSQRRTRHMTHCARSRPCTPRRRRLSRAPRRCAVRRALLQHGSGVRRRRPQRLRTSSAATRAG